MDASPGAPPLVIRLFEQHGPAVYRYFRRLTADAGAAEDLSQEVFLRIVRHGARYEPRERERAWIFRIARNVLIDHERVARRAPRAARALEAVTPPAQAVHSDLQRALAALATDDREAFLLAEVGGLTYAEIAAATGSTVPAVRSRIYRARLALRDMLPAPPPLGPSAVPVRQDDE